MTGLRVRKKKIEDRYIKKTSASEKKNREAILTLEKTKR